MLWILAALLTNPLAEHCVVWSLKSEKGAFLPSTVSLENLIPVPQWPCYPKQR